MAGPRTFWTLLNREALVAYVRGWGAWGPAVFIGIQAVQVIFFVIPGELTGVVGGYLFGTSLGFTYSMIGLTLGTMATFGIGHLLGRPFLRWVLGEARYARLEHLAARAGPLVAFVLYVVPGFPKDVFGYLFGASKLSVLTFFVVSTLARMPGTWLLTLEGAKAGERAWQQLTAITVAAALIAAVVYWYRERILAWVSERRTR